MQIKFICKDTASKQHPAPRDFGNPGCSVSLSYMLHVRVVLDFNCDVNRFNHSYANLIKTPQLDDNSITKYYITSVNR